MPRKFGASHSRLRRGTGSRVSAISAAVGLQVRNDTVSSTEPVAVSSVGDASMPIDLEWRIPWEAGWSVQKKIAAAERLVKYMTQGTFFETASRARVIEAKVVQNTPTSDPFIKLRLER